MYLKLELSTTGLRTLFWAARDGSGWWWPLDDHPSPHCALCGAREYPHQFPLPHPWPRLHEVVTSMTEEQDGQQVTVHTGDIGKSLYLPVEEAAKVWGDEMPIYLYHFCRYHGRPETAGWVDCMTAIPIEWFPEPGSVDLALFNLANRVLYTLWVTGRFLWSLLTFRFVSIRLEMKRKR